MREYIIELSKEDSKVLVELAEKAGFDDELGYLQQLVNELIEESNAIEKALVKGMSK